MRKGSKGALEPRKPCGEFQAGQPPGKWMVSAGKVAPSVSLSSARKQVGLGCLYKQ